MAATLERLREQGRQARMRTNPAVPPLPKPSVREVLRAFNPRRVPRGYSFGGRFTSAGTAFGALIRDIIKGGGHLGSPESRQKIASHLAGASDSSLEGIAKDRGIDLPHGAPRTVVASRILDDVSRRGMLVPQGSAAAEHEAHAHERMRQAREHPHGTSEHNDLATEGRQHFAIAKGVQPAVPAKKTTYRATDHTPHEFETRHLEATRRGFSDAEAAKYARSDAPSVSAWREAHPAKSTPAKKASAPRKLSDMSASEAAAAARRGDVDKAAAAKHIRAQAAEHDRAAEQLRHPDTHEPDKVTGRQQSVPSSEADRQDAAAKHAVEADRLRRMADRISPAPAKKAAKKAPTALQQARQAEGDRRAKRQAEASAAGLSSAEAVRYSRSDMTLEQWRQAHPAKAAPAKAKPKKLTAHETVSLPPEELAQAARDGRISRPAAAAQLRKRAELTGLSGFAAGNDPQATAAGRERFAAGQAEAARLRALADQIEARPAKATPRPAKALDKTALARMSDAHLEAEHRRGVAAGVAGDSKGSAAILTAVGAEQQRRRDVAAGRSPATRVDVEAGRGRSAATGELIHPKSHGAAGEARLREVRARADARAAAAKATPRPVKAATPRKATGTPKPPTARQRALTAGLSPTDATAYSKWEKEHPGESVSAWQAQRRDRTAVPTTPADMVRAVDGKAATAPQLRALAEGVGLDIPPSVKTRNAFAAHFAQNVNHPGLAEAVAALPDRRAGFSASDFVSSLSSATTSDPAALRRALSGLNALQLRQVAREFSIEQNPTTGRDAKAWVDFLAEALPRNRGNWNWR